MTRHTRVLTRLSQGSRRHTNAPKEAIANPLRLLPWFASRTVEIIPPSHHARPSDPPTNHPPNPQQCPPTHPPPPPPPCHPSPPFTLIVATTPTLGIGLRGTLPWPPLKPDLRLFARVTKRAPPARSEGCRGGPPPPAGGGPQPAKP